MFIETEDTPNPATLKFLPGCDVTGSGAPVDFSRKDDSAGCSELAEKLFDISEVRRVFLGRDFVSVTKDDSISWNDLRPVILSALSDFFESGRPVLAGNLQNKDMACEVGVAPEDKDIVAKICELLETRVRPAVAADGGDIVFRGYKDGVVFLMMQGACSGCPSSRATLRHGVENMLRHYVPEVTAVEQVEE